MSSPIFITGIGTDIGKTVVSAIVCNALKSDYWKPVQAGFSEGTDAGWVSSMLEEGRTIYPEAYKLAMPASPHIAAREEGKRIDLSEITAQYRSFDKVRPVVIEGAGGLMVPLNGQQFMLDLIKELDAITILVSRNYLGSINHSLLTAKVCRAAGIRVAGWIFNDQYLHYEEEIVEWSGYPKIGSIPYQEKVSKQFVQQEAGKLRASLELHVPGQGEKSI